ncbi:universal stress protein [Salipaludibacillus neizhouensis]|uniref:Universal stress protein n=1 Tax=Salipaludibacillus neizhouensis TaxID=885475 RepID=A0A3A9K607_9BACI|nr:universal stress protein [Salipaludibacillus neizhouensis]RKL65133.1 universal stress protein [Salipaludibacillus neizhouensis]
MFNNLLVAIDGSDHSKRALEKAIELAKLEGNSNIELLYVVAGNKSKSDVLQYGDSDTASMKRKRMLLPIEELVESAGVTSKTTVLHGKKGAAESIIEHANEGSYDALVIGSRGLGAVQTMIIGSVSHKVMKYVEMPVLMVK